MATQAETGGGAQGVPVSPSPRARAEPPVQGGSMQSGSADHPASFPSSWEPVREGNREEPSVATGTGRARQGRQNNRRR